MAFGDCPKCGKPVLMAGVAGVQVLGQDGNQWNGVKFYCMSCQTILSIGVDPVALKNDIVNELIEALRKR
jgi:hypothetical protein